MVEEDTPSTPSEEVLELEVFLLQLSNLVRERLNATIASGALFRTSYQTVEQGVRDYVYAIGMSEVRIELLPQNVDQWVWKDKGNFINEAMSSCPTLAEGIEMMIQCLRPSLADRPDEDLSEIVAQRAVDYLSTFVLALTDRLLQAGDDQAPEMIDLTVQEFMRDLRQDHIGWDLKAYLKCLWMEEGSCPLGEGLVLRRPRLDDYQDRKWVEGVSWGGLKDVEVDMLGTSVGAILEMSCAPSTEAEARGGLNVVLDALLLFRVSSLSKEHLEMRPRSVLAAHQVIEEGEGKPPLFHAVLRAGDHGDLSTFVRTMVPLIRHHPFVRSLFIGHDAHARNMLRMRKRYANGRPDGGDLKPNMEEVQDTRHRAEDLAFSLYRGALLDHVPIEERIAKLVAGLEHLYLKGATIVDRKRGVALRASSLLEGWGFDALKVARDIREGFKVKGELYNTSSPGMMYKEDTLLLCEDLADYLRASLVIFYQACVSLEREKLVEATDLLVQAKDLPPDVAKVLEGVFVNESVSQPYR